MLTSAPVPEGAVDRSLNMYRHPWPGKLIAVSGIDGSGKTTLIRCIAAKLKSQSIVAKRFKFPSRELKHTALFREFDRDRELTLASGKVDLFGLTMVLIGDRLITIRSRIIPHLQAGHTVIVDRYIFTTLVEFLVSPHSQTEERAVWASIEQFPQPDYYLLADVPIRVAAARIRERGDDEAAAIDLEAMDARAHLFRDLARANGALAVPTDIELPQTMGLVREHLVDAGILAPADRRIGGPR